MRPLLFIALTCVAVGCGDSNGSSDQGVADLSMSSADLSASVPDMMTVMPYNMPGKVFCYTGPACTTPGAASVCCDSKGADGGFTDSCVASAAVCTNSDPMAKTFECGQAADCGGSKVCCGNITTLSSGKKSFSSTVCAASCTSTQTQLCVTAAECTASGAKCVGQSITGRAVGLCQ